MKKTAFLVLLIAVLVIFVNVNMVLAEEKKAEEGKEAVKQEAAKKFEPKDVERVTSKDIYDKVQTGEALLVCAYPADDMFAKLHLKGAISFKEFESKLKDTDKKKLIVFYCGWPDEGTSAGLAVKYLPDGYNVKALGGGTKAWKKEGYEMIEPAK